MEKKPFTPAGFEALQTELYALTDQELQVQADAIAHNFKDWIDAHFELTAKQGAFLHEIAPKAVHFLAQQTSFAVDHRLPVIFAKDGENDDDKTGKVIKPKSKFTVTANSGGNMVVEGELHIQIYYQS